jgi:putative DNA primase/helicase
LRLLAPRTLEPFRDRNVIIRVDNDSAGREKAKAKLDALAPIARSIRVVSYPDTKDGGDVTNWLESGHDLADLLQRCEEAEPFVSDKDSLARPLIQIRGGMLSAMATEAERHLLEAGVPFYQRAGKLVRPVVEDVPASDGRKTTTVAPHEIDDTYMRDQLCRTTAWQRYIRREGVWVDADAPKEVAQTIRARVGDWAFAPVSGVITTPTLRPDGSILKASGYDTATRLLLVDPPAMPEIPDQPTREDGEVALRTLNELLDEFPFLDAASRSVALSTLITPVVRGAMTVAPMHVGRAPTAGSGKSFLFDTASAIATGQRCTVIAAGRTEEETEKRLAACVLAGYQLVSIDNVNGELGGDFLCQVIERPVVSPRVLGRSEQPRIPNRMTLFATGNNMRLLGDMTRRAIISSLDAGVERPELREFKRNPVELVLADRGRYVAAALTVVRAYFVAHRPNPRPRLASFGEWSDTVRSALTWLGQADPVDTMTLARAEDPELQALTAVVEAWVAEIGAGRAHFATAAQLLAKAQEKDEREEWEHPALREAVEMVGHTSKLIGKWLAKNRNRIVGNYRMAAEKKGDQALRWYVESVSSL